MNKEDRKLMDEVPLMKCGNKLEFQQRLQWLSEGMLAHHINNTAGPPNQEEIRKYREFRKLGVVAAAGRALEEAYPFWGYRSNDGP